MAKFTIGGEAIEVGPANFDALEICLTDWIEAQQRVAEATNPADQMRAMFAGSLTILRALAVQTLPQDASSSDVAAQVGVWKGKIVGIAEIRSLAEGMGDWLRESGVVEAGEPKPGAKGQRRPAKS